MGFLTGIDGFASSFVNSEFATLLHGDLSDQNKQLTISPWRQGDFPLGGLDPPNFRG